MESYLGVTGNNKLMELGLRLLHTNVMPQILFYGNPPEVKRQAGKVHGGMGDRAGISSVPR